MRPMLGRLKNRKTGKFSGAQKVFPRYPGIRISSDFSVHGRFFRKIGEKKSIAAFVASALNGVTASSTNPGNRAHAFRITVVELTPSNNCPLGGRVVVPRDQQKQKKKPFGSEKCYMSRTRFSLAAKALVRW